MKNTMATPYQPSLLRVLHGAAAALAAAAWITGFLIYNHFDGRFGRLPLWGSEQLIELHGDLGGLLPWVLVPFALYALTLGAHRLLRPADLGRLAGSPPAWQRLTNTAALLGLAAGVLSGLPMEGDWLEEGTLTVFLYGVHLSSWLALTLAVAMHLLILGRNGGWPLLSSMLSFNLRRGDRPGQWPRQVLAILRRR
jgi:hypothetical protein